MWHEGNAVVTHLFTRRQVKRNVVSAFQNTPRALLHCMHATGISKLQFLPWASEGGGGKASLDLKNFSKKVVF